MSLEEGISEHRRQETKRGKRGGKWTTQAFSVTVFQQLKQGKVTEESRCVPPLIIQNGAQRRKPN
jgi:hypothetical protein